jgi:hypothetical protein
LVGNGFDASMDINTRYGRELFADKNSRTRVTFLNY